MSYQLGLSDHLSASPFASRFGSSVHNALEEYVNSGCTIDPDEELLRQIHKEDLRPYDEMQTASKKVKANFFVDRDCAHCPFYNDEAGSCRIMNKDIDEFEGCPRKIHEEALDMMHKAIERYKPYFETGIKSEKNPNGKVVAVEKEFTIVLGKDDWGDDIVMHGFIDLVVEEDENTLLVIDYKTGYKTQNSDELFGDLQARMYSAAAKIVYPEYEFVMLSFDYFRGVPTEVVFTEEEDSVTLDTVKQKWNQIKGTTKVKRRREDFYCKYLCNREFCDKQWDKLKNPR
jgi:hypothetical protein